MKRYLKRAWRIASFTFGAGLAGLGAGNLFGVGVVESMGFGAALALVGLTGALAFTHAGKGEVNEKDFDTAINSAIETVKIGTDNKK